MRAALLLILLFASSPLRAELIDFHTTNIQLLRGWDYEVGDEQRTLITFEHYNRWTYGDFFMFVDSTRLDEGSSYAYGEFSPRVSLSKVSGESLAAGPLKDFYLSGTLEKGKRDITAYLYGGAVDLDVPGFTLFRLDLYKRDNPEINGSTWQVTWVWKYPFELGGYKLLCEGFADIAGDEGSRYRANQYVVPRTLIDIGDALGGEAGRWYTGVEWQYWHNKFGRDGVTEFVPQLQIKWVFD